MYKCNYFFNIHILPNITKYHAVSQNITRYHKISRGITKYHIFYLSIKQLVIKSIIENTLFREDDFRPHLKNCPKIIFAVPDTFFSL